MQEQKSLLLQAIIYTTAHGWNPTVVLCFVLSWKDPPSLSPSLPLSLPFLITTILGCWGIEESDVGEVQSEDWFMLECKNWSQIEPRQYHFSVAPRFSSETKSWYKTDLLLSFDCLHSFQPTHPPTYLLVCLPSSALSSPHSCTFMLVPFMRNDIVEVYCSLVLSHSHFSNSICIHELFCCSWFLFGRSLMAAKCKNLFLGKAGSNPTLVLPQMHATCSRASGLYSVFHPFRMRTFTWLEAVIPQLAWKSF